MSDDRAGAGEGPDAGADGKAHDENDTGDRQGGNVGDQLSPIPLPEQPPMDDAAGGPTADPTDDTPPPGDDADKLGDFA